MSYYYGYYDYYGGDVAAEDSPCYDEYGYEVACPCLDDYGYEIECPVEEVALEEEEEEEDMMLCKIIYGSVVLFDWYNYLGYKSGW